ncbi:hypothetical protein Cgig2_010962 [Carnegiea gigantea]|uniref:Uncharacterized protein n=1 Tax=Carnegiea gigantea TaxID=171969 RepID=A0A9Q1Q5T1_9CARY|nr:hypothetical protein Cgig2_010962 [Carnegiea gigantea]
MYSHYKERTTKDGMHLEVGMMFVDKKQLKEAIEDYQSGYGLRTMKSHTGRLYLVCKAGGVSGLYLLQDCKERNRFKPLTSASSITVVAIELSAPFEAAVANVSISHTTDYVTSNATSNAFFHHQLGKLPSKRAPRNSQTRECIPTQESTTSIIWDV